MKADAILELALFNRGFVISIIAKEAARKGGFLQCLDKHRTGI